MELPKYRANLEENLLEPAKDLRLELSFIFQQDKCPNHTLLAAIKRLTSRVEIQTTKSRTKI